MLEKGTYYCDPPSARNMKNMLVFQLNSKVKNFNYYVVFTHTIQSISYKKHYLYKAFLQMFILHFTTFSKPTKQLKARNDQN